MDCRAIEMPRSSIGRTVPVERGGELHADAHVAQLPRAIERLRRRVDVLHRHVGLDAAIRLHPRVLAQRVGTLEHWNENVANGCE